jgi:ubiquinone biosynthesis UbiH/UbiF/VisC/COQ6 family hydroxylase
MRVDVAVVGAGPAGLCFARSLAGSGLAVALVERQRREALAAPADDGREIALTLASRRILEALGVWERLDPREVSPLRAAQVMDGAGHRPMRIEPGRGRAELGWLVPNHAIRRAACEAAGEGGRPLWLDGESVLEVDADEARARLRLSGGGWLEAGVVVAAEGRFSESRRLMGIGARMRDFGRSMLVCRMAHEQPHRQTAWEWFGYGQTLALLPLNGGVSSAVLSVPHALAQSLMGLDEDAFARAMQDRFRQRLGAMRVAGGRHLYPLAGAYARRFCATRYALLGDAAVGMHPVTAHGFNFALQGQQRLAALMREAARRGGDVGEPALLERYERAHRRATLPLYLGTELIASLYTDDRLPARLLRAAALGAADRVLPFRRALAARLLRAGEPPALA